MTRKREKFKRVLKTIQNKADVDNIFLMSSSVAFHSFLSFIPIISVLVGIYLILNFNLNWDHFILIKEFVPPEVYNMVEKQAERINTNLNTINIATAFSFLISLWLANNVTRTLAQSLNIVFDKKNEKHFLFSLGESIVYTLLLISSFLFLGLMLTVLPILFSVFKFDEKWDFLFLGIQWVVIAFYMVFGLCFVYKYLPAHGQKISWRQFLPGALVATGFGSSIALMFSFYVGNFGSYNKVYGALGVIVITMLWLRLTFASILFGGEVNYFLLKDPSLREYFSIKAAFQDQLEDQSLKINWKRSTMVIFLLAIIGFRLYLPSEISKEIRTRFEENGLRGSFSDVDLQMFLGDYHLEDFFLNLGGGDRLRSSVAYNHIGWRRLGAKSGDTGISFKKWSGSFHIETINESFGKIFIASEIIAYRKLQRLNLESGRLNLAFKNGTLLKLIVRDSWFDRQSQSFLLNVEGEGRVFKFKGKLSDNVIIVKTSYGTNRDDMRKLELNCELALCPSVLSLKLKEILTTLGAE